MILETHSYPGDIASVPLLIVHATGLHGRVFGRLVEELPAGRPTVIAPDLRGHGRSRWPQGEPFRERLPWDVFSDDLAETVLALHSDEGLDRVVLVGHSMGAHSAVLAAAELESSAPGLVAGLVLFDPTIGPRGGRGETDVPPASEQPVMRRRNSWASPQEMFESFRGRPPFASWDERALRDYCEGGLTLSSGGESLELACTPAVEASVYAARADQRVQARLDAAIDSIVAPVWVVRARDRVEGDPAGLGPSATAPELASRFARGFDRQEAGTGHFFPLEDPARAAAVLWDCLQAIDGAQE